jgi:hypothetical protein
VRAADPILELHYRDGERLNAALPLAARAIVVEDEPPVLPPLIADEIV